MLQSKGCVEESTLPSKKCSGEPCWRKENVDDECEVQLNAFGRRKNKSPAHDANCPYRVLQADGEPEETNTLC